MTIDFGEEKILKVANLEHYDFEGTDIALFSAGSAVSDIHGPRAAAAMQRAEKNIDELREELNQTFHRLRQSGIDEELFDVLAGFENIESEVGKKRPISRPGHPGSAD